MKNKENFMGFIDFLVFLTSFILKKVPFVNI